MQPVCSREIQAMNSLLNQFDPTSSHGDFLDQILSTVPSSSSSSWPLDLSDETTPPSNHDDSLNLPYHFDDNSSALGSTLATKLRSHHITSDSPAAKAASALMLQHQLLMSSRGLTASVGDGSSGLPHLPLSPSFKSCATPGGGHDDSVQALYNGFSGALHVSGQTPNQQPQHFQNPQALLYGSAPETTAMNQTPPSGSAGGGSSEARPRQRIRARRGQATDPHSIAERLRRERIAERMKSLQELVPNANKTDKASMLDEIIDYVKFLQLQVKVLSMSRLGGAAAAAGHRVTDQGGGDSVQTGNNNGTNTTSSSKETMTMTEHQVAKLMEEDMGSAMQYLQGKGLCLMPISLATAISTTTCHSRNPMIMNPPNNNNHHPMIMPLSNGSEGPSSPSISVLTVQSAANINNIRNGVGEGAVKDTTSVSKP